MSSSIELSKSESDEIIQMMNDNSSTKVSSKSEKAAKQKLQEEMNAAYSGMKKLLKLRSKNELVEIVWTYAVQLQEMQRVAQILLEENKALKPSEGESND